MKVSDRLWANYSNVRVTRWVKCVVASTNRFKNWLWVRFGIFVKNLTLLFKWWSLGLLVYPMRCWTRNFILGIWVLLQALVLWYCRTKTNLFFINLPTNLLLNIFENRTKSRIVRIIGIYVSSRSWFISFHFFFISFSSSSKRSCLNSLLNNLLLKIFDDIFFKIHSRTWCVFNLYVALALRSGWHKWFCKLLHCCIFGCIKFLKNIVFCLSAKLISITLWKQSFGHNGLENVTFRRTWFIQFSRVVIVCWTWVIMVRKFIFNWNWRLK